MIVRELWREAARFPGALTWSMLLLVLVCATHIGQAVAVAAAMSSVIGGQARDVLTAMATILAIALVRFLLSSWLDRGRCAPWRARPPGPTGATPQSHARHSRALASPRHRRS